MNTNAAYLSEQCAALGLSCYYQSVVGDNEERLEEAYRHPLHTPLCQHLYILGNIINQ